MTKLTIVALIGCATLYAQDAARPGPPFVRATGEGIVSAKPDQATVTIGVVTQASTAAEASSENATQVEAVLARIKKEAEGKGEIKTAGYHVHPNYGAPNPLNRTPKIVSYSATNTVEVKLSEIALVGRVIDAATATGANQVNGIQFSIKDERAVRAQALREAALNARSAAEALASALGVRVVRVHSAETSDTGFVRPMQEMAMAKADFRTPTPVEPGDVQVRATVTVTLEVMP